MPQTSHTHAKLHTIRFDDVKINRVIRFLIFSDIMIMSGWGFINPILAVFIADQVVGGSLELAGGAIMAYFFVKSILQLPVSRYLDSARGERDDFWFMIIGTATITFSAFLYIWATKPWHVYTLQIMHGVGAAMNYPSWQAIFTRHIDKHEESFEWSLYYTAIDMGSAFAAAAGGYIAQTWGYPMVFMVVGVTNFIGTSLLFFVRRNMLRVT